MSEARRENRGVADGILLLGAAAGGTAIAWLYFASRPPMPVLSGLRQTGALVPAHYQASVFPAFCWFSAALGLDLRWGSGRGTRAPRAALLASTGLLAVARLGGALPLSGHALFLSAVIGFELAKGAEGSEGSEGAEGSEGSPSRVGRAGTPTRPSAWLAAPGLAITAWYKLAVWDDGPWLAASALVGGVMGLACGAWARRTARRDEPR